MTVIIPEGFARVGLILRHSLDPVPWMVTYGISMEGIGATDPHESAVHQAAAWENNLAAITDSDVELVSVQLQIGQGVGEDHLIFEEGVGTAGGASQQSLPQNCALMITKRTALGGRKGKGRCFWPSMLVDGNVSDVGIIDSTAVGVYQTAFDSWFADITDGVNATPMVILHNDTGGTTPVPTVVTAVTVDPILSTQRRRLR